MSDIRIQAIFSIIGKSLGGLLSLLLPCALQRLRNSIFLYSVIGKIARRSENEMH